MESPDDRLYRALESRDARFDGHFFACVRTTGVYCRPVCSARTPKREHVSFVLTAAAAEAAGFRPCRRCRPDGARTVPAAMPGVTLRLSHRPPLDWDRLLAFVAPRATPGVEVVAPGVYARTIRFRDRIGTISVRRADERHLAATVDLPPGTGLPAVAEKIRRTFDLRADPLVIVPHLRRDPELRAALGARRDVRVPGAWDGFELAVRAVLGQQVTVRGATTLAGRLAERFGRPWDGAVGPGLDRVFPTPADLVEAPVETIGIPGTRADALRALAGAACDDADLFDPGRDVAQTVRRLRALPGIGDWTAQYVAMRVLGDSDAFPAGDLGLRRILGNGAPLRERELRARAEAWRPWRSYAAMAIWESASA